MAGVNEAIVLHIIVVDFHHQKGATVSYTHPPLSSATTDSLTQQVPYCWRHLPHVTLPDGSHNYNEGSVYFTLPSLNCGTDSVYGIACFRQVETKDLLVKDVEVTRSTVQKSICVLCRLPVFGFIETKLSPIVHAYFSASFADTALLESAYKDLAGTINSQMTATVCHLALSPADLVNCYQHRLLQIFKALLLGYRILVYGSSANSVSKTVMSLVSLVPLYIEHLMDSLGSTADCYGFPLRVFPSQSSVQPYISLQQMDMLTADKNVVITGAANPLFEKQKEKLCDIFISLDDRHVDIIQQDLHSLLHLTIADLRFCSLLASGACGEQSSPTSPLHVAEWYGSHDWVRLQFKMYLLSLLATSVSGDSLSMEDFNTEFVLTWVRSPAYKIWASGEHLGISKVTPTHLCEGQLTIGDLKRRLYAQMSDYGLGLGLQSRERVSHVFQSAQHAVAGTTGKVTSVVSNIWNTASSTISSWWSSHD